jgi:hypothetical protein
MGELLLLSGVHLLRQTLLDRIHALEGLGQEDVRVSEQRYDTSMGYVC